MRTTEKELVESCVGAVHSSVKYALSKTEKTGNQIEMGQQNFGWSTLPFSYIGVATSRDSANLFGDLILEIQQIFFFCKRCCT